MPVSPQTGVRTLILRCPRLGAHRRNERYQPGWECESFPGQHRDAADGPGGNGALDEFRKASQSAGSKHDRLGNFPPAATIAFWTKLLSQMIVNPTLPGPVGGKTARRQARQSNAQTP